MIGNTTGMLITLMTLSVSAVSTAKEQAEDGNLSPTSATESPIVEYRNKSLGARYSFWRGLKIHRAGKELDLGYFGRGYQDIFEGSPAALESMETYRKMRISGVILYGAGLAALVSLMCAGDSVVDERPDGNRLTPIALVVFLSGVAVSLTGAGVMQGANAYLSDAIERYNYDLYNRLNSRVSHNSTPFRLAYSFSF